jgi:hypothetical protein
VTETCPDISPSFCYIKQRRLRRTEDDALALATGISVIQYKPIGMLRVVLTRRPAAKETNPKARRLIPAMAALRAIWGDIDRHKGNGNPGINQIYVKSYFCEYGKIIPKQYRTPLQPVAYARPNRVLRVMLFPPSVEIGLWDCGYAQRHL